MKYILPLFILLLLGGCSKKDEHKPEIETIDLFNAFENKKEVILSQFVEDPEYIPLELTLNSVLAGIQYPVFLTEDYIIVRDKRLLLFDRNTGKFIKEVGKQGRGPDEYGNLVSESYYNEDNDVFYAYDQTWRNLLIYNLEGRKIGSIRFPVQPNPPSKYGFISPIYGSYLDSVTFAYQIPNSTGTEKSKLVLYTNDSIIRLFPNFLKWGDGKSKVAPSMAFRITNFIRWDKNLYFKELFNDTLFEVTKEKLIPRLIFNGGKYSIPYALQDDFNFNSMQEYFSIWDMVENSRYLFFQLGYNQKRYTGYYDKTLKSTIICDYSFETNKSALIDDINNFMPITPYRFTKNNEMVAFFNAQDIVGWIGANPGKAGAFSKKFPWLNTIDDLSNPVIFIAKCRD